MATTGVQALPYPSLGDAANGPVGLQNLALAVEKKLVMSFATVTARNAALPAPAEGALAYVTELDALTTYQDGTWFVLGVNTPTSVNAPAATALPSAYPYGVQSRWVSGDATWPNANGIVVTERTSDTRCWQTFRASQTTVPGIWMRRANLAAGPWSAWEYYVPNAVGAAVPSFAEASGSLNVSGTSITAGGTQTATITFPAGRFTVAPNVVAICGGFVSGSGLMLCRQVDTITTTSARLVLVNAGTVTTTFTNLPIQWYAVQMTSTSADG